MGIQVYEATKDGQGNPLSILSRQFISFSYGGKNIEDFGLLAVFEGDRFTKDFYAPFQDTVTTQAEIDGQIFWRSKYNASQLHFSLATDGMTSQQYEDFKNWFTPGVERELILSEYHNRVAKARVSIAPTFSLLPFEKEVHVKIGGVSYTTKTTLYKGSISLTFVMDDPFWYSKADYFSEGLTKEDAKVIYEDKIPHINMLQTSCFLSGENYYNGLEIKKQEGVDISKDNTLYLYNCSTAPVKPEISFTIQPSGTEYITFPFNNYQGANFKEYCYLQIGDQKLEFTTPSILTSYNRAIEIIKSYTAGDAAIDLRADLRDNIKHYYVRAWAVGIIDSFRNDASRTYVSLEGALREGFRAQMIRTMEHFIKENETSNFYPINFVINSRTGIVEISTKCRIATGSLLQGGYPNGASTIIDLVENSGDMLKSNYIQIDDKKIFSEDGIISENECLPINSNCDLSNLKIKYQYTYL